MQTPLMSKRRRKRLSISCENGITLISLGEMEIWDGADLALIRDTLFEQILDFEQRDLALDMKTVKYIPSGFFGMLGDWKDRGISITVLGVQPHCGQHVVVPTVLHRVPSRLLPTGSGAKLSDGTCLP